MIPENIAKVSALSEFIPRHFFVYVCGATALLDPMPPHCWRFRDHTHAHTLGRTSLDEGSARRRDDKTQHSQDIPMPPAGFEPAIPASERLQIHAVDLAAAWIGTKTHEDLIHKGL
jgi:hypothetical protein